MALRQQASFLQEDGPDGGLVAAVEPVDSEEEEAEEDAVVCTTNGLPRLKDHHVDLCIRIVWAYSCRRDVVAFGIASLSLTFGVADLCGCLYCARFQYVGRNTCSGIPRPQRYVGSLLHGRKRDLPPGL
ncbi:hypothetical protein NDU88_000029 [Pleurodeles waltl]|uniref:Uncharacterized protein n=1 Tax=Pleurodeles waltl TaxID=8319 RepID=A0AAV7UPL2_PLEWA|nr:hypothetical protein NDU88_000029 [Pleurodeles waltl]